MIKRYAVIFAVCSLFGLSGLASAAPVHLVNGQVTIDYDLDAFIFNANGFAINPSAFSVSPVLNGVQLSLNNSFYVEASTYTSPGGIDEHYGDFSALFVFNPLADQRITGYSITYSGFYETDYPSQVSLNGPGGGFTGFDGLNQTFDKTFHIAGSVAPALNGAISAKADVVFEQIVEYQYLPIGTQQVLDYCEAYDSTICYYHEEIIYDYFLFIYDGENFGRSLINLQSITIAARIDDVPLPGSAVLFASTLASLCGLRLRCKVIN